ncbi:MAG: amino acid ABC transporter ATP-binding protein [Rhizobiaceae bacterium]|nr:amino acid ABC transporter ATP-binding protein [Rhizobiaceae bacterium]
MPIVEMRGARKKFGDIVVLDGVDLEVAQGETIAIIGRSGSGKSTLLRCLNGLETIDGGTLVVDGVTVDAQSNLKILRSRIGFVFQSYNLFPHLTVMRNIMLGPTVVKKQSQAEAEAAAANSLAWVGLSEKRDAYPAQLSGGQQQRVALARCLAMAPVMMLCDEVTSALDPELVGEVLAVLERLTEDGMTMLLVTHEMKFARRCATRVLFMHNGKIWEQGPAATLFDNPQTEELKRFLGAVLH